MHMAEDLPVALGQFDVGDLGSDGIAEVGGTVSLPFSRPGGYLDEVDGFRSGVTDSASFSMGQSSTSMAPAIRRRVSSVGLRNPRSTRLIMVWDKPALVATAFMDSPNASRFSRRR